MKFQVIAHTPKGTFKSNPKEIPDDKFESFQSLICKEADYMVLNDEDMNVVIIKKEALANSVIQIVKLP